VSRRVFYDPRSPAAVAAAALLADRFVTRPWTADDEADGILLTGIAGEATAHARVRVIGLVDGAPPDPWPPSWYFAVPARSERALLLRAVTNAFDDLDASAERTRLESELSELTAIGIQLSAERDVEVLFETILTKAREITRSDAGSLYLIEEAPDGRSQLRFVLAQNASRDIAFRTMTMPLDETSVAGHVALTGAIVNLADAYDPPAGATFRINRWFDEQVGYRTKSMLVVPMRTPHGETLGVLQLINCRPTFDGPLDSTEEVDRYVRPFGDRHVRLVGSLASQAAVAFANRRLYESIRHLFEGFVKAAVTAIESRDPTTSGHSFRVAELTVGLAEIVDRSAAAPYRDVRFSADELRELRYAALLHDFGKVGVREHVLVKSKKLYAPDLERIRHRVESLMRDLELDVTRRKLDWAIQRGQRGYPEQAAKLDAELAAAIAELGGALELVEKMNEPTVLPQDFTSQLAAITARSWADHRGQRRIVLTPDEAGVLALTRGSLTEAERLEIQQHVVHTFQFLAQIPWTQELRRIPEIARAHHEKLNGSGYPFGARGHDIPIQSRMMTIVDIYDALTATDRPYKKAIRVDDALDILRAEQRAGALDGDLLDLFIEARIFERLA
jgi:HD-GYP domain-containing protein (c-di-GMP phosphodiesterase class II)